MLAENISNADTPNFRPRDLVEPKFDPGRRAARRDGLACDDAHQREPHRRVRRGQRKLRQRPRQAGFQTRPAGNAVSLEDEMMKVSANQMDYAAATALQPQPRLFKTAIGKR